MTRVTFDAFANAAYLHVEQGEVSETISSSTNVNFDFDSAGNLLGIEVLNLNQDPHELTQEILACALNPELVRELLQELNSIRAQIVAARA